MVSEPVTSPVLITDADQHRARRLGLLALCITEIISWGVLYYAFPVALSTITADTGWSASGASAAFSAGLVVSAIAGIIAGRLLDARGPRLVMTAGSLLAVPAVLGVAFAPTLAWFTAAWALAGVAMAGVLYPSAFAAITRWYGEQRMQALLVLTLVAGLSSTIFAPLTAVLLDHLSWRTTFVVLAVLLGLTTVPLHAFALRPVWPKLTAQGAKRRRSSVRSAVRSAGFVLLCASFTTLAFGFYVASLGLIPLLTERGFGHSLAATTLGLLGAGQLLGRLAHGPLANRLPPWGRLVVVVVTAALAALGLAVLPAVAAVLIAAAVIFGAMRGLFTLLQAGVIADRWGTSAYGTLSGIFTAPITVATAVAPWAAAALAGAAGSSTALFIVLAGLIVASAATGVISWWFK